VAAGWELVRTPVGQSEAVEGDRLAFRPAGLLAEAHRLAVVLDGRGIAGPVPVEVAQAQGRRDLCAQVALGDRGRPGGAGDVLPGCGGPQPEVAAEGVGEQAGQRTWSVVGGMADGRQQVGGFQVQPFQGLGTPGERRLPLRAGVAGRGEPQLLGVEQPGGRVGAAQVQLQQPPRGRRPLPRVDLLGSFGGVQAQQVVQAVASRDVLVDQMGGGQSGKGLAGVAGAGPDEGRGRRRGEVRPGYQAEQAEELAFGSGQALVGRAERGPDGGVGVALDLQRGQPVLDPERGHLGGDGLLGVAGQVGRGDPQRQRQMRAGPGQVGGGVGFGLDALGADDLAEQRLGLLRMQRARTSRLAPWVATSPARRSRLVTATRQPGLPGSNDRTWSAVAALSSSSSSRRPAVTDRYRPAASSRSSGTWSTPSPCSSWRSASIGRSWGVAA
jgi:hypothetical protein